MAIVNLILANRWITARSDPHAGKVVRMDAVLDKLTQTILVHVDATRLSVMDFTLDNSWIGASFHFEASNAIVVDVIFLKVSLKRQTKRKKKKINKIHCSEMVL